MAPVIIRSGPQLRKTRKSGRKNPRSNIVDPAIGDFQTNDDIVFIKDTGVRYDFKLFSPCNNFLLQIEARIDEDMARKINMLFKDFMEIRVPYDDAIKIATDSLGGHDALFLEQALRALRLGPRWIKNQTHEGYVPTPRYQSA